MTPLVKPRPRPAFSVLEVGEDIVPFCAGLSGDGHRSSSAESPFEGWTVVCEPREDTRVTSVGIG